MAMGKLLCCWGINSTLPVHMVEQIGWMADAGVAVAHWCVEGSHLMNIRVMVAGAVDGQS